MCGIFGIVGENQNLPQTILQGLKTLEYRGYDSWGIAAKKGASFEIEKHIGKIDNAKLNSKLSNVKTALGIGHTRWATHGGVTTANAHPHTDCKNQITLVHNGIIENYQEIKTRLKNHKFKSQTDTEVAIHYIEELAKKYPLKDAITRAFNSFAGMNAIVVLDPNSNEIFAVKNGSPLVIGKGKSASYIASDTIALLPHTNKIAYLEDNVLAKIDATNVTLYDIKQNKNITPHFVISKAKKDQNTLGKYKHYMEKEISEQKDVIALLANQKDTKITKAAILIKKANNIYLVGSGTASYAALTTQYLLSSINKINSLPVVASEFENIANFIKKGDLVIAFSQSGETADLITALKAAKKQGATILAIVNVPYSTVDRMSSLTLYLNAGPEVAVVSTKAFTAKIAIAILLCYQIENKLNEGKQILKKLAASLERQQNNGNLLKLISKLNKSDNVFTIGRNIDYPIALEAALKLKETAYIHAEGFAAGELKHGVIALIEKGTPAFVFATQRQYFQESISSAMQLKARGAYIVGISIKNSGVFDVYLPVKNIDHAQIISAVIYAQHLAFKLALKKGLDPDKPRNLAKSVTVK